MEEYKLELKQVVDYPRCRMYRQFIQGLIGNENLRMEGAADFTITLCFAVMRISELPIIESRVSHIPSIPENGSASLKKS